LAAAKDVEVVKRESYHFFAIMALPHLPTAVLYHIAQQLVDEFGVLPTSEER
jgi:hypothetical protein